MEKLTVQQARVLKAIREYIDEIGYPPSVRELGKRLGLKSTATVHSHLRTLERKRYLQRTAQKSRAFTVVDDNKSQKTSREVEAVMVPVVGMVRAGVPVLAVENIDEYVPLPHSFVKGGGDKIFMLQVEGESMIGAGIYDGDLVLVRQQESADNGDIVVALLDDEATVKTFYKEQGTVRLQPQNPKMDPIISTNVRIIGKVIGLYRLLH